MKMYLNNYIVYIQQGKCDFNRLPCELDACDRQVLEELNEFVPLTAQGIISYGKLYGINTSLVFVDGSSLQVSSIKKDNKQVYHVNHRGYSRENVLSVIKSKRRTLEENLNEKSNIRLSPKQLYNKLAAQSIYKGDNNSLVILDTVVSNGSGDEDFSAGEELEMYYDGNRLFFKYTIVSEGESYERSYNNTRSYIKEYPKEVSVKDIVDVFRKNGVMIQL